MNGEHHHHFYHKDVRNLTRHKHARVLQYSPVMTTDNGALRIITKS